MIFCTITARVSGGRFGRSQHIVRRQPPPVGHVFDEASGVTGLAGRGKSLPKGNRHVPCW